MKTINRNKAGKDEVQQNSFSLEGIFRISGGDD